MSNDLIKEGLKALFEKEKKEALVSNDKGTVGKKIAHCVSISGAYNRIIASEIQERKEDREAEAKEEEKKVKSDELKLKQKELELKQKELEIRNKEAENDVVGKEKKLRWDIIIGAVSAGLTLLGIGVSLYWEKEGSFSSSFGRTFMTGLAKNNNKPKL